MAVSKAREVGVFGKMENPGIRAIVEGVKSIGMTPRLFNPGPFVERDVLSGLAWIIVYGMRGRSPEIAEIYQRNGTKAVLVVAISDLPENPAHDDESHILMLFDDDDNNWVSCNLDSICDGSALYKLRSGLPGMQAPQVESTNTNPVEKPIFAPKPPDTIQAKEPGASNERPWAVARLTQTTAKRGVGRPKKSTKKAGKKAKQ